MIVVTVLPADTFSSQGVEYRIYDGMQGTLEAELRSETLLDLLLPDLEESW